MREQTTIGARFYLTSVNDFDFNEVAELIGLQPSMVKSVDEYSQGSKDAGYAKAGMEYLISDEPCRDTDELMQKLMNLFMGKEEVIKTICQRFDLEASIVLVVQSEWTHLPFMHISKEAAAFAASINAEISLDMYVDEADPDERFGILVPKAPYLPLGSVVLLKGGEKKLMIFGRMQKDPATGKRHDYAGCLFPEGNIDSEHTFMFDHDAIEEVCFEGWANAEEREFQERLQQVRRLLP